ncbi:F-box domain, cyclin-like protein [Artemisia annua]|uniref:F-box domain, cyclin-like protein n=1 Tax=Artemisia annua TaxID=35608 RepID=A0A2U1MVD3_ARTAN|nr:F-box domain, cyclin-like protein [Artemisia annua]
MSVSEVWFNRVYRKAEERVLIFAMAMAARGIEDQKYWNWVPTEESRFNIAAYLQQIWWFEVDGSLIFPFSADIYKLSFRIRLEDSPKECKVGEFIVSASDPTLKSDSQ